MIRYYHRVRKQIETEKVYGEGALHWAYQTKFGFFLTDQLFSKTGFSRLMGLVENSRFSTRKIKKFIDQYQIPMQDFEETAYASFNDFFIRKFKAGIRNFNSDRKVFCAGAEARYLAYANIQLNQTFPVKGFEINLNELFQNETLAKDFLGGTFILARLCPVDYHRFHFPISGTLTQAYTLHGALHSVNPAAFAAVPGVFLKNERQIAIFQSEEFGKVAMIEVGALGVGKIVQSAYRDSTKLPLIFDKGLEKGYFLFGGSTVIFLLQKNRIQLSQDLLAHSHDAIETWIPLGDTLGETPTR